LDTFASAFFKVLLDNQPGTLAIALFIQFCCKILMNLPVVISSDSWIINLVHLPLLP